MNTFWFGKPEDEPRQHDIDFAVRNSTLKRIENPSGNDRISKLVLHSLAFINIVNV